MSGFTMIRPYVEPGRSVPRNPDATNRRREVLTTALGIVPEWAIDNSIAEFTYTGTTTFDDTAVARFAVADSDGTFGEIYFDASSHLPIAYRYRLVNGASGAEVFEVMRYQRYRRTDGVVLPTRILRTGCDTPMDQSAKFEVTAYRVNAPVDYDLLRPPDGGRGALRVPPVL
jgi:hypothetical protein